MTVSVGSFVTLIVVLVAVAILTWLAFYVLRRFNPPEPVNRIVEVIIVVIAVLVIVGVLFSIAGVIGPVQITP